MKRNLTGILVAIIICVVFTLSACANKTQTPSSDDASTDELTIGSFTEIDLIFTIDDAKFALNSDAALLLNAFGEDYTTTTAPSCVYEGEDKAFEYSFASIFDWAFRQPKN